ncbi:ribonuclease P protein component [Epilithonimonas vandammei]|uniref:Ribonuclease P protein component n=1 Tax=Epilithonimonas vandammei TaxID=2487072 RepID=A0A3G8ZBI2_9FLAO|nr:ribonuclease P protein component [Epilithonimonas vandammei]AZI53987.1 ribonuclease P protein component [Epilithonimonas vandammei]
MKQHGFPKQEKLKKKSDIDLLFKKGKWLSVDNLRIIYLTPNDTATLDSNKTGVSVSKKFFKKAVDRNRLKRLLREAYRLNKPLYKQAFGEKSLTMLFWVSKEMPEHYSDLEKNFLELCKKKTR